MRGLTSIITGMVLMGAAVWILMDHGPMSQVAAAGAAAIFLMYRGYHGIGTNPIEAVLTSRDLASNPVGTIVDVVVDQVAERADNSKDESAGPTMDHDAIIARYLENRPESASVAQPTPAPAAGGFGRKGLAG